MNHFMVTAKCGHVGKGQYYKGVFFVCAENGKQAAAIVRKIPRVKHDHKDAILGVDKVSYAVYKEGKAAWQANQYFSCRSKQEQELFFDEIAGDIYNEACCEKRENADRHGKLKVMRRHYRKMDKYNKLSMGA
ncbi:MAG: hypothetical protein FWB78_00255 [Treponema sp.]|nr:hypothetical protein [Treponema sp.]